MKYLKVKTKGNSNPKGKPRAYFTCHPDDYDKALEKVCSDIFKTHDCAIYYTENMADEYADVNWETDLNQMNLFVIPVTFRLLSTPNRTMSIDLRFAKENHIPVLPIMLEKGIDEIYSKEENFGELQYLNPYDYDLTAISYEEKLKKYLDSVLISDELAKKIRAAFDAYIFLSYRKKDRKHANELMQIIHSNPLCQNIAIWYDEFLTPGESFKENISKILENSKLFALLVTPSLLEEPDGKPNYVMGKEYPEAKKSGIEILPAEMIKTDSDSLREKYNNIPDSYRFDSEEDKNRFIETISKLTHEGSENNPEHNYLLGLAYLDGIDVEVNKGYALKLFEKAHKSALLEATKQLAKMYVTGNGVEYDIYKAAAYELEVISKLKNTKNDDHSKRQLITELIDMANICASGTEEKMEPSPQKTLSIPNAISYYREAVHLQEEIINSSENSENDIRLIRKYLSVLCNMLHGWKSWTNMTYDEVIKYYEKFAKYSTDLGKLSDFAEDIFYWRESNYCLLKELHYDSLDYEDVFRKTIEAAKAAIKSGCDNYDFCHEEERVSWLQKKISELDENAKDSKTITKKASLMADLAFLGKNYGLWRDYARLLDILYYNGVCYYMYLKDYAKVCIWLQECYLKLKEFREIFPESMERLDISMRAEFDIGFNQYKTSLHLVSSGSVNAICSLIKQPNTPDKGTLVDKAMRELIQNYDKDDTFMRDAIIPGLRKMIEASN